MVRANERMYSSLSEKIVRTFLVQKSNGSVGHRVKNYHENDGTNQSLTETHVITTLSQPVVETAVNGMEWYSCFMLVLARTSDLNRSGECSVILSKPMQFLCTTNATYPSKTELLTHAATSLPGRQKRMLWYMSVLIGATKQKHWENKWTSLTHPSGSYSRSLIPSNFYLYNFIWWKLQFQGRYVHAILTQI